MIKMITKLTVIGRDKDDNVDKEENITIKMKVVKLIMK